LVNVFQALTGIRQKAKGRRRRAKVIEKVMHGKEFEKPGTSYFMQYLLI
jgi:hypothetical protein